MALKQLVEDLLKEVNEARTKVDNSPEKKRDRTSTYALFSSWPDDKNFQHIYRFFFDPPHTSDELLDKFVVVFRIIGNMLTTANNNLAWATNGGHITGEDLSVAKTILGAIQKHLQEVKDEYFRTTYGEFARQFSAASGSLLVLGPALAQLKALSMPSQGCDCACGACGACKTCVGAAVIRKKKQAGCRCTACAKRATARTAR
jgi:hypothetical protein